MLRALNILENATTGISKINTDIDIFSETTHNENFDDVITSLFSECKSDLKTYSRYQDNILFLNACKDILPSDNTYLLDFIEQNLKHEKLFIHKKQLHSAGIENLMSDIIDKSKKMLYTIKEKFKILYKNISNALQQMTLTVKDCINNLNNVENKEKSKLGHKTIKTISPLVLGRYFSAINSIKNKTLNISNIFNYNRQTGKVNVFSIESIFRQELNAIGFKSEFGILSIDRTSSLRNKQEFQLSSIDRQALIKIGNELLQNHKNIDVIVKNFNAIFSKLPDFKTETLDPDTGSVVITSINMNIKKLHSNLIRLAEDIFKQNKFITKNYIKLCKAWLS